MATKPTAEEVKADLLSHAEAAHADLLASMSEQDKADMVGQMDERIKDAVDRRRRPRRPPLRMWLARGSEPTKGGGLADYSRPLTEAGRARNRHACRGSMARRPER